MLCEKIADRFRGAAGAAEREERVGRLQQARELMGVLETIRMPTAVAVSLKPVYERCRERELLAEDRLKAGEARKSESQLAEVFDRAAALLKSSPELRA